MRKWFPSNSTNINLDESLVLRDEDVTKIVTRRYFSLFSRDGYPRIVLSIHQVNDSGDNCYKFLCQTCEESNKQWNVCALPSELIPDVIEMWQYVHAINTINTYSRNEE